jgi:hypothetical protein
MAKQPSKSAKDNEEIVADDKAKEVPPQDPADASTESEGKSKGAGEAVTPAASRKITIPGAGLMDVSINGVQMQMQRGVEMEVDQATYDSLVAQRYIEGDK